MKTKRFTNDTQSPSKTKYFFTQAQPAEFQPRPYNQHPTLDDSQQTVTTAQAAEILGVSRSTVTRLVQHGQLKAHKLTTAPNSPYRITRSSLDRLLEQRQVPEKEAATRAGVGG